MFDPGYMEQVRLLLNCMPTVADQACFALKGGSAINLFMRNMPRISVDIDLYAGKLCAALDRQHPRDLFDVKVLLDDTGITPEIRRAFVVYLVGHNRPMHELLRPNMQDISATYRSEFVGMVQHPPAIEDLTAIQRMLAPMLVRGLTAAERQFLLSMKSGDPDWDVLGFENLQAMPALQWKLLNIRKMDVKKRTGQLAMLERVLQVD